MSLLRDLDDDIGKLDEDIGKVQDQLTRLGFKVDRLLESKSEKKDK
jgi:hypothetical protein